ncbi:oligopeptide transport system permease protein OppC [Ferrovum sp. JA12]|uniref:ABC transporter permease n=1 Tax=Ferrovum sp. JA12 TaxID=1356299 RepID=UPI000703047C|nr:ABC transporter permease [Ferrovum sp. JA12]KRH78498.1 oligopeptide transport system permease protein OppC [Ferrovum sp. JA12]
MSEQLSYQAFTPSFWGLAQARLRRDAVALTAFTIVMLFILMSIASYFGFIAKHWGDEVAINYAPPSWIGASESEQGATRQSPAPPVRTAINLYGLTDPLSSILDQLEVAHPEDLKNANDQQKLTHLFFGADKWGRSVALKTIKGSETSILVGLIAALVATFIGTLLGALAGYFGGWVDDLLNWFYNVFTAIPYLLLIFAIAAVLHQKGVSTIILILGSTGWTGVFRLVRAEYLKHAQREYVLAAKAMGASHTRRMFIHILPNTLHVVLVQLSINVVGFIKSEVILSFLGFGVPVEVVSWGSMLNEAQNELVLGIWWQLLAAGLAMALLVTAFSVLTDALRDALDPKVVA